MTGEEKKKIIQEGNQVTIQQSEGGWKAMGKGNTKKQQLSCTCQSLCYRFGLWLRSQSSAVSAVTALVDTYVTLTDFKQTIQGFVSR